MRLAVLLALALTALRAVHASDDDGTEVIAEEKKEESEEPKEAAIDHAKKYVAPSTTGLHFAETFDGDVWSRWTTSEAEKYDGKFQAGPRGSPEALIGDVGFAVPTAAMHYGASASIPPLVGKKDVPFVVQFEVKFQEGLQCGGSYLKLFDRQGKTAKEFVDGDRFVIMFGPDKCGSTDKVHFIFQHKNPKSGNWEEKHFKEAPSVPYDQLTHLYGLIIRPDNSFDIQIDGVSKASGNLLTSMQPSVNPMKEIDDPADTKPGDWVEDAMIDDPESSKPDEWDEDEPHQIIDPEAKMPDGWKEEAEKRIPDPDAKRPDDWDDDEDGEWEAPIVDNAECKVGCGKWEPPKIANPKYKGKWHAPRIDNPEYKGIWKPKQIPNPDFFEDESPYILPEINAVGIDIWTMQAGILFDNIVLATDVEKTKLFTDETFMVRKGIEELQKPAPAKGASGMIDMITDTIANNPIAAVVTITVLIIASAWFCCFSGGGAPEAPSAPERKARTDTADEKPAEDDTKEAAAEDSAEKSKDAKLTRKSRASSPGRKAEKATKEGGLGDIGGDED